MGTLSYSHSPPIYTHLVCNFFIKIIIIISMSTDEPKVVVCSSPENLFFIS